MVKCAPAPATATCSDALHFVKLVAVAVAALLLEVSATATLINDSYVFIGCVTQIFSLRPHWATQLLFFRLSFFKWGSGMLTFSDPLCLPSLAQIVNRHHATTFLLIFLDFESSGSGSGK